VWEWRRGRRHPERRLRRDKKKGPAEPGLSQSIRRIDD
jgi:hypothetical protein